jgi:hypothetical protein
MAATAASQKDVANNIQYFFVQQKAYPAYLDSLLVSAGGAPTALYLPIDADGLIGAASDANNQVGGLPNSGPDLWKDLEMVDLGGMGANAYLRSFSRSGFNFVMDHDTGEVNASNSGKYAREVPNGKSVTAFPVARVKWGSNVQRGLLPNASATATNTTVLVALGFGPQNSAIGKTAMQAPVYPGCDGKYYGRYVAIFMVYKSGERATLLGVVDSYGRYPDYSIQQFNESLPDGGRRG